MRLALLTPTFSIILALYLAQSITKFIMTSANTPVYHYLDIGRLGRGEVVK